MVRVIPRSPKAWISCPEGLGEVRRAGAMLVDTEGVAYPCPPMQAGIRLALPVIELPAPGRKTDQGGRENQTTLARILFHAARFRPRGRSGRLQWIDSIRPINEWSLELVTRQGTSATFGLGDHARQIESLRAALDHAGEKGYVIDTINLIPKYNIPITLRDEPAPPRAIPVRRPSPGDAVRDRRARDLGNLLNRN
jgi:hypothetical protein